MTMTPAYPLATKRVLPFADCFMQSISEFGIGEVNTDIYSKTEKLFDYL